MWCQNPAIAPALSPLSLRRPSWPCSGLSWWRSAPAVPPPATTAGAAAAGDARASDSQVRLPGEVGSGSSFSVCCWPAIGSVRWCKPPPGVATPAAAPSLLVDSHCCPAGALLGHLLRVWRRPGNAEGLPGKAVCREQPGGPAAHSRRRVTVRARPAPRPAHHCDSDRLPDPHHRRASALPKDG